MQGVQKFASCQIIKLMLDDDKGKNVLDQSPHLKSDFHKANVSILS